MLLYISDGSIHRSHYRFNIIATPDVKRCRFVCSYATEGSSGGTGRGKTRRLTLAAHKTKYHSLSRRSRSPSSLCGIDSPVGNRCRFFCSHITEGSTGPTVVEEAVEDDLRTRVVVPEPPCRRHAEVALKYLRGHVGGVVPGAHCAPCRVQSIHPLLLLGRGKG